MEAIVALVVLVAVVWGAAASLRGGLLAGALGVLFAGICLGYSAWHVSVGPAPLTLDRVLWAMLMVQFVFWRHWGLTERRPAVLSEKLLLAWLAVLAVGIAWNGWDVDDYLPVSQFLFYYAMPLGMYWVASRARLTERGVRAMFALMGLFGVYLALTAVAERWEITSLVFPRYINTTAYKEFLGRSRGPLLNPMANGVLLGSCLAAGLMFWPGGSRWKKLALAGFAAILLLGVFCTMTRSVWMGGLGGLLLLVFVALPRLYRPWLVAAAVVGSAVFVATQWENLLEFKRDKYLSARETASSAELRPVLAAIAWEMFCDRPLLGCGLGHYPREHVNYLSNRDVDVPLERGRGYVQHNVWLALLTETGLFGVGLFTILWIAWIRDAWRLWRNVEAPPWMRQQGLLFLVVALNYVVNGMFHDISIIPMVHMVVFFSAGLTVNLARTVAETGNGQPMGSRERG